MQFAKQTKLLEAAAQKITHKCWLRILFTVGRHKRMIGWTTDKRTNGQAEGATQRSFTQLG